MGGDFGQLGQPFGHRVDLVISERYAHVANHRQRPQRLPRIISACSEASWVVTMVSPATVETTAGLPPS